MRPSIYNLPFEFPGDSEFVSEFQEPKEEYRFIREAEEHRQILSSEDAANYFSERVFTPFDQFTQEEIFVLTLNQKNIVTHEALVYRGTVNSVHIRVAEIFRPAILVNAVGIVIGHPHPSGDPTPSIEDVKTTEIIVQAGKLLDLAVLDHIVTGRHHATSLRGAGLVNFS